MLRDAEPHEMGKAKSDTPGTVLTPCEAFPMLGWAGLGWAGLGRVGWGGTSWGAYTMQALLHCECSPADPVLAMPGQLPHQFPTAASPCLHLLFPQPTPHCWSRRPATSTRTSRPEARSC